MRRYGLLIFALSIAMQASATAVDLPIHADDKKVIEQIVAAESRTVQTSDMPAWSKGNVLKSLQAAGVETQGLRTVAIADKDRPQTSLGLVYDAQGRVLALSGNGPWLRNSSLRALKNLPELRAIRIDHNGHVGKGPLSAEYDGSGFDALADSKLVEIKIGLGFSDKGMEQCSKIKSLRSFTVAHSQVTDAGVAFFAGHPNLTEFSVAEMASKRVTGKSLESIARMPRLTHVGFKECYVTYQDGLDRLLPLKGQLQEIDLTMCVVAPADMEKLKADHPKAKIVTIPPAEIVKRHKFIAANLARQAPPELAAPLQEALKK